VSPPLLETFPREEWRRNRLRYEPSQGITIIGAPGTGKTHLAFDMAEVITSPDNPFLMLVKKPRDKLIETRGKAMGLRRLDRWPPPAWHRLAGAKPRGWLVWPETNYSDIKASNAHKANVFRAAILDTYKRGHRLMFTDDAYGLSEILKLRLEMIEAWTEFRSQPAGFMSAFQRAAGVPLWSYQAEHLCLFKETDKQGRRRFAEIGGVDPDLLAWHNQRLLQHQFLHVTRTGGPGGGPSVCIVDR